MATVERAVELLHAPVKRSGCQRICDPCLVAGALALRDSPLGAGKSRSLTECEHLKP